MSNDRLKVGVIGVGHLGRHHARNYAAIDSADLVGVYDPNPTQGRSVAVANHTQYFEALDDLLARVQAVSVVTPTQSHHAVVHQALEANCHVLVEKPITTTVAEADDLIHMAAQKGRVLQVGHIERFNGAIMAAYDHIKQPLFIECHRLAPFNPRGTDVSVVLDLTIHDLDIVLGFVGGNVASVQAVGVPVISQSIDIVNVRLEFVNGCVANITTSRVSAKVERKIRFFQRSCYVSVDLLNKTVDIFQKKADLMAWIEKDASGYTRIKDASSPEEIAKKIIDHKHINAEDQEPLRAELVSFIDCVQTGKPPTVSGVEGRRALHLAYQIIEEISKKHALTDVL